MKILMISGDSAVLDPNSEAGKRMDQYRKVLGEVDILLYFGGVQSLIAGLRTGYALLRKNDFSAITAQSPEHWLLAWVFSRLFKIPWQAQVHTDIFSPYFYKESLKNKLRVWMAKFLLPRADNIRVVSERIKNSLVSSIRYPVSKIMVLPIFVDVKKIQSAKVKFDLHKKYPDYDFIILMASRLTQEKNISLALEAMQNLATKYEKIMNIRNSLLLIVGDGPEREALQKSIVKSQLSNVKIEPWTDDLASCYKTADLFLLTSDYEGYGRTVVEAMAAGLPVIMTDVGLAGELLIDDLDGRITPVGDAEQLTRVILELIENTFKREEFKANALKLLQNWPRQEEYLEEYKNGLRL